jgi:hypothetical protein
MNSARNRLNRALAHSPLLRVRRWDTIGQDSYHNNTNIRTDSDIDLCVCLMDAFYVDGPYNDSPTMAELGRELLPFTYEEYKQGLAQFLRTEFGSTAVDVGQKALHVHKDDRGRIAVDVVPAFKYQLFGSRIVSARLWLGSTFMIRTSFRSPTRTSEGWAVTFY